MVGTPSLALPAFARTGVSAPHRQKRHPDCRMAFFFLSERRLLLHDSLDDAKWNKLVFAVRKARLRGIVGANIGKHLGIFHPLAQAAFSLAFG